MMLSNPSVLCKFHNPIFMTLNFLSCFFFRSRQCLTICRLFVWSLQSSSTIEIINTRPFLSVIVEMLIEYRIILLLFKYHNYNVQ